MLTRLRSAQLTARRSRGAPLAAVAMAMAAAVGFGSSAPAPAEGAAGSRCERAKSSTLVVTKALRVYRRRGLFYACAFSRGRHFQLSDDPDEGIGPVRAAGPYVGFASTLYNKNDPEFYIKVLDARTGRTKYSAGGLDGGDEPYFGSGGGVFDLEMKPNGSIAWIVQNPYYDPPRWEVNVLDRDDGRNVAAGQDIAARSLALSGSLLYWTQGGKAASMTLR